MSQPTIMYVIDDDYTILSYNDAAAQAYPQLEVGKKCYACLSNIDEPCPPCPVANKVLGPHTYFDPIRKIGETVDAVEIATANGKPAHALVISSTDSKQANQSELDQLTGRLNRYGLIRHCLENKSDLLNKSVGAIALGIESYDEVIYLYGLENAQDMVKFVSAKLSAYSHKLINSWEKLAYVGGGLFLGLIDSKSYDISFIPRIIESIEEDSPMADLKIKASLFEGIYDDDSLVSFLEHAETTLHSMRDSGTQVFKRVNADSYRELASERHRLSEILKAIDNDEFDIYFQPKCQISNGLLVGAEALARWIKPSGEVLLPENFIPLLEQKGFISRLDLVVWEKVFQRIHDWIIRGIKPLPVSLNVSRVDIAAIDVPETLITLAAKYDVAPIYIEIEITESAFIEDKNAILVTEQKLQEAGFRILIDDFGSGFSSLATLKNVNADVLKLDMGFLNFAEKEQSRATDIVYSVLNMAHQLDMYVIVEGVETIEQAELLNSLGCQFSQGFYFYRPMPPDEFEKLLKDAASAMVPEVRHASYTSSIQRLAGYFWRVAEVNLETGTYHFIRNVPEPASIAVPRPATMDEYGQRYIEHGYIHPDDIERYRSASSLAGVRSDIAKGIKRERQAFRFLENDGSWKWYVLEILVTDEYSPESPWVLFTWKEGAEDTARREDTEALVKLMYSQVYRVNLDTLVFERIQGEFEADSLSFGKSGSLSFVEDYIDSGAIHPDDAAAVLGFMNLDSFREHFLHGGKTRSLIFRIKRENSWIPFMAEASPSVEFSESKPTVVFSLREAKVAISEAEARRSVETAKIRALFEETRENSLYEFLFNASQDMIVFNSNAQKFEEESGIKAKGTITEIAALVAKRTMPKEHAEHFLKVINAKRLVKLFNSDIHYDQFEYQRKIRGELRWTRVVVHVYSPMDSDDVWGNGVVCDIQDDVHRQKLEGNVYLEDDGEDVVFDTAELLESIPGGFFVYEGYGDKRILYANNEVLRIFRCETPEQLQETTGGSFRGMIHPDDLESVESTIETQIADDLAHNDQLLDYVSYRIVRRDGSNVWVQDYGRQLCHDKRGTLYAVFLSEVADARMDAYRIAHRMGITDMLCDILNRNSFEQRKNYVDNVKGSATCVFFDLNGLHELNNEKGHDAGDEALKAVAEAVKAAFGENDSFRTGGDEFVVLARGHEQEWGPENAKRVKEELKEQGVYVSIGWAFVENLVDVDDLVKTAEANMRADKRAFYAQENNRRER